jgi:hypothetical protein
MNFIFASWLGISAISHPSRLADMQIDKVGRYFRSFLQAGLYQRASWVI